MSNMYKFQVKYVKLLNIVHSGVKLTSYEHLHHTV